MSVPVFSGKVAIRGLGYQSLVVAVTNLKVSIPFYNKVGFKLISSPSDRLVILKNDGGLGLHLYQTTRPNPDGKNQLMDLGNEGEKYPGHTHMSFGVQSLKETRKYMEEVCKFKITGERPQMSLFIRDPDATVLEWERNDKVEPNDPNGALDPEKISKVPRNGLDHIGTRIGNPPVNTTWYQQAFGWTKTVFAEPVNMNNLRAGGQPWIIRSETNRRNAKNTFPAHGMGEELELQNEFDINLIPNASVEKCNILLTPGLDPLPGIIVAAIEVEDVKAAEVAYREAFGDDSIIPVEAGPQWGLPKELIVPVNGPSFFVRDPDLSVFRLVPTEQ